MFECTNADIRIPKDFAIVRMHSYKMKISRNTALHIICCGTTEMTIQTQSRKQPMDPYSILSKSFYHLCLQEANDWREILKHAARVQHHINRDETIHPLYHIWIDRPRTSVPSQRQHHRCRQVETRPGPVQSISGVSASNHDRYRWHRSPRGDRRTAFHNRCGRLYCRCV
jgi:hypothetical protein